MSDIDKKLKELLADSNTIKHCCGQSGTDDIQADIKLIKQAFIDEGWIAPDKKQQVDDLMQQITNFHKQSEIQLLRLTTTPTPTYRVIGDVKPVPGGQPIGEVMTKSEWEHQAIKDGWVKLPQVEVVTRYEANKKPEVIMVNGKEVMTGQEWYDKFEQELGKYAASHLGAVDPIEVAKKAAGIE